MIVGWLLRTFRSIALWGTLKKKPLVTLQNAHLGQVHTTDSADMVSSECSSDDDVEPDDIRSETSLDGLSPSVVTTSCSISADFLSMQKENWVTSVAALHNTDLVVSGKTSCWIAVLVVSGKTSCWIADTSCQSLLYRHCVISNFDII